jgi:hypothetical protein
LLVTRALGGSIYEAGIIGLMRFAHEKRTLACWVKIQVYLITLCFSMPSRFERYQLTSGNINLICKIKPECSFLATSRAFAEILKL